MSRETLTCGDIGLWEKQTKKTPLPGGGIELTYTGDEAFGGPITAQLAAGWKPRTAIEVWYNHVIGVINERQNKQEIASAQRAQASGAGGGEDRPAPRVDGGSEVPVAAPVQDSEGSVAELLEAKVAALSRSVAGLKDESEAASRVVARVTELMAAKQAELHRAIKALKMVKGGAE